MKKLSILFVLIISTIVSAQNYEIPYDKINTAMIHEDFKEITHQFKELCRNNVILKVQPVLPVAAVNFNNYFWDKMSEGEKKCLSRLSYIYMDWLCRTMSSESPVIVAIMDKDNIQKTVANTSKGLRVDEN